MNAHIGSHRGTDVATGTARLADGVAAVLAEVDDGPDGAILALENSAGGGDGLGTTVEEIAAILEACAARGVPARRLGVCLDTAHLWGAGHRHLATRPGWTGWSAASPSSSVWSAWR